jgi:hypothetical protein
MGFYIMRLVCQATVNSRSSFMYCMLICNFIGSWILIHVEDCFIINIFDQKNLNM